VLIVLAALMQIYDGLSSALIPFLGLASLGTGMAVAMIGTGVLQAVVAVFALMQAVRNNLRGAILAAAGCLLLGWLTTVPAAIQHGLDFRADGGLTSGYFLVSPALAFTSAALAWRNSHLLLAALVVTAPTIVGLFAVMIFATGVALYGF
jgi:hypothetical protein